ncbi:hypothetical protein OG612_32660 [Streptomyces sp. NBC_01527]|uniref:hypothetical protein n=1 Tax=Streptomyces sp. NBC_01527 TaxID=2903894 RepID=UPI003864A940
MLDRFTELAGAEVSREELLAAVTAPGRPHPWRALLARTWREAQLEVAALLRDTVATRSGGRSRLGLMSSGLGAASVEGRDWHRLFRTLGEGTAHRPHFAPYGDAPASSLARSVALLELQRPLRPADAEVAPEVENWPHTEWSKSDTQTWSEMVTATFSGADALLLNVLPFTARTPQAHARTGRMLSRSRPALRWAAERSGPDLLTLGVGLPWYGDAGQAVRTRGSGSMRDLEVDELAGAAFLLPLGTPVTARQSAVSVLFGDLAWAAPDDDVRRLLNGGLLLDGAAAAILTERGYGDQLGVQVVEVAERDQPSPGAAYALERLTAAGAEAAGVLPDTLASVNNQPRIARLSAVAGTQVWSRILDARQEHWGDGLTLARNDLGGQRRGTRGRRPAFTAAQRPGPGSRARGTEPRGGRICGLAAGDRRPSSHRPVRRGRQPVPARGDQRLRRSCTAHRPPAGRNARPGPRHPAHAARRTATCSLRPLPWRRRGTDGGSAPRNPRDGVELTADHPYAVGS